MVDFKLIRGIALEEKAWSETRISSSRNLNGQVSSVGSSSTLKRECWIRLESGKEVNITLPDDTDFSVREGQALTLVGAYSDQLEKGRCYCDTLINHTTGKWIQLSEMVAILTGASGHTSRKVIVAKIIGVGVVLSCVTLALGLYFWAFVFIPILFVLIVKSLQDNHRSDYVMSYRRHLEQIVSWCFQNWHQNKT